MNSPSAWQPPTKSASELHRHWLELVDTEGPFLAVPALKRVWPNGIPDFRKVRPDRFLALADARKPFELAWEALDLDPEDESALSAYRSARDEWVQTVLRDVIGWADLLQRDTTIGLEAQSPSRAVGVSAQAALNGPDGPEALVLIVDPTDSLRQTPNDGWAATPVDRIEALLRKNEVEIGIVTDGRWWGLVSAAEDRMAASGIVDALTWVEEPRTRDAFFTLTDRQYIIGGDPNERLPVLFEASVAAAEEITEALGAQVRRAVELLIQSFSESAAEAKRLGQPDPLPARTHNTYEAAVTVMMRTVFLLFAEERGLLPSGELFDQGYGISQELDRLSTRESNEGEEALDSTSLTWHRLLATSRALFGGASFESLRMPSYGGSLFDPARFPFLSATNDHGGLAIAVSDRVMLPVLRSVQVATVKGDARRISFRDVDVEQIGYIYEGLLGYTCTVVDQPYLGLIGATGAEPEIPLAKLEQLGELHNEPKALAKAIRDWIAEDQPSAKAATAAKIAKSLQTEPDPSAVSALALAVGDDESLRNRVSPWLGIIRRDLRTHPFVVLDEGLLVQETPSRKNAGAHYTPKSLAEEVVLHALQPLCYLPGPHQTADESTWKLRSSDEILHLKVADIACGSGAFLVAAARYLSDRVVEAWISEDPANGQRKDLYTRAIRQVVANCLYGADINDMAVEMCKLSLWLVSLDRDLPFSFVDDKVFIGNSLLGLTSLKQLRKMHIDPSRVSKEQQFEIFDVDIDAIIRKAVDLRERLATEIDESDPARTRAAKHRQLNELRQVTASLREISDGVVAAGLPIGGKPGKPLDEAYDNLRQAAKQAFPGPDEGPADPAWLHSIIDLGLTPSVETDYLRWKPLHWVLEAPDVIVDGRGFDAIVGNPPFLGGKEVSGAIGSDVREWLVNQVAHEARGNADLVAYFFLRTTSLLGRKGNIGLVATNTIAQGDTREVGLDQLTGLGMEIVRAVQSSPWPAASASLEYAAVWATLYPVPNDMQRTADNEPAKRITTLLEPGGRETGLPIRLAESTGFCFVGCNMNGKGFEVPAAVASEMIESDARNRNVLFPVLGGEEVNKTADGVAPMWAVDFFGMELAQARAFDQPCKWVEDRVKPHRQNLTKKPKLLERWWRYERDALAMRTAVKDLDHVLVIALVSKTVMPVRVATDHVFTHALGVFATESYSEQAVLSSSIHQLWAIKYGSGMRNDPRYTPSDVFETFPRAHRTDRLEAAGRSLDEERRHIMERRGLGLTKLYNAFNSATTAVGSDSDIDRLREVHVELDKAAMDAYGWADFSLNHGFHSYRKMERWTVSPLARVEILDRLLEENHHRADAEAQQAPKAKGRRPRRPPDETKAMF